MKQKSSFFALTKIVLSFATIAGLVLAWLPAYAATPVLSVAQNGNTVTLNVSNANTYSPVYLYQRQSASSFTSSASLGNSDGNGNFTSTQTISFDGSSNPVYLYVMVANLQSPTVQIPPGACTSGCASGTLSLSQTSVAINSPSSITVTSYPTSGVGVSITGNTNSSVANAFTSGNSIIITGQVTGSTTVTVCSTASTSQCGSIFVSVNGGSSTTLNFSNANPIVIAGQSSNITIYSPSNSNSSNYYISNNSNANVVTNPSISGVILYFSAGVPGTSTLTVCQSSPNYCGTVTVTVGSNGSGALTVNPNTLTLTAGSTGTATISNSVGALTVTNNSNSSVVSASVSTYVSGQTSQTVTVYAETAGSSVLTICPVGSSTGCVYLYVQVASNGSTGSSGGISFSLSNPVMAIGQSQSVAIYSSNGSASYSISNNSSPSIASLSLSGSSLYLVGENTGNSSITVCEINTTVCGTLYVTVNGSGSGLNFSPSSVNVAQNQSSTVTVSGGSGSYYLSSNSSPSVAAVSLQASSLYITGLNSGVTTVSICQSNNASVCGTLEVTVGTASGVSGSITFSNSNPTLAVNQSQSITLSGGGNYYISSISNPSVLTVNLAGSQINLTGVTIGSSILTICQTGGSSCGTLTVTVSATGSTGSGSVYFPITTLPAATIGQYYSYQLQAAGGNGNYTYSVVSGNVLPSGLSLSSSGLLSGTPAGSGSINDGVSVTVVDSSGNTGTGNLSIFINGGNGSYASPTPTPTSGSSGGNYPSGQLINENGTVSIVYQNSKIGFANAGAFTGLGFNFSNVTSVSNSGLSASGQIVNTSAGQHPWGSWVLNGSTVYFVQQSGLIPVPDWNTFLNNGGQASFIVPANSYDMALPQLSLMALNDTRVK